jgi:hypothetical protein
MIEMIFVPILAGFSDSSQVLWSPSFLLPGKKELAHPKRVSCIPQIPGANKNEHGDRDYLEAFLDDLFPGPPPKFGRLPRSPHWEVLAASTDSSRDL